MMSGSSPTGPLAPAIARPHAPTRSNRLAGQSIVVFGGGSSGPILGNGQAAAIAYALAGAHVTVCDALLERAAATVDLIQDVGGQAVPLAGDVSLLADIEHAIEKCREHAGRVDVLHFNVGITLAAPTMELSRESWERTFAVNATGCFLAIKTALPIMKQQRAGVITTISSVASMRYTNIPYAAYSASKAAVNQLTLAVALEHAGDGIRANSILPGLLHTSLVQTQLVDHYGSPEQALTARAAKCPMGFMGDAWDVANAAVFLASSDARYITGQSLVVDGGLTAACG
jgi:NAD(P)-dependent dehydrogenase (short-subunit alcohol dehydrogenase family)